jgi:hypothetical protein
MDELLCLILNGFDHLRVAVPGCDGSDPRSKIKESVAIHIPDFSAPAVIHDEWISSWIGGRNKSLVLFDNGFSFWTWKFKGFHVRCLQRSFYNIPAEDAVLMVWV